MSKIKTFRGLLGDGVQEHIRVTHRDGKTGYRLIKFEMMPTEPGIKDYESVIKIFSTKQTAVTATVDFSEQTLLAAGFYQGTANVNYTDYYTTTFDRGIFNQDIFVTHQDLQNNKMNFYIELEQYDLDENEATATILKNFRNTNSYAT